MTLSRSSSDSSVTRSAWLWGTILFLSIVCFGAGCAGQKATSKETDARREGYWRIAVFPVENLSGQAAPLGVIRGFLVERLRSYGIAVLDDEALDRVFTRNRIRYTAGVEAGVAKALREEEAVEAILIPSLELYDEANPPKVAMFCRLVSTADTPRVIWIDGTGMAGDDSPGILGLGLIEDPQPLLLNAVESLARSLGHYRSERAMASNAGSERQKFRPKIVYRSDVIDPERIYSIAVMPFFNKSARKFAGEIIALHMIRNLMAFENFEIVEPGIVRQQLLRFRIIMTDGVSLPETETILGAVNADVVLNGEIFDYRDYSGPDGIPKVAFSVLFIERKTRRVIYSSYSVNQGDDGVVLFDWGRVNMAHSMASQMARAISQRMLRDGEMAATNKGLTREKNPPQQ